MPAKAGIQYSVTLDLEYHWRRGVLDHPPSRMTTAKLSSLSQRLEYLHQLGMHELIAAHHIARLQRILMAIHARDKAAGFAHHDLAGGDVPRLQITLPVAVEAAGSDERHVERGGAEAAQARDLILDSGHLHPRQLVVAAANMRQAAGDHAFVQLAAAGDAQPLVVEKRALAALGDVQLLIGRIVDHARDDGAFALQPDRDRELRDAVQKVGGAVERVDDPGVALVGALAGAAFLAHKAVTRPRLGQIRVEHLFRALVGKRDEIGGTLQRHLQILDLAEVALEAAAGAARGLDHDVDDGGIQHEITQVK